MSRHTYTPAFKTKVVLEKKNTQMLKTIGQLTLERDFLRDCFRLTGQEIPPI